MLSFTFSYKTQEHFLLGLLPTVAQHANIIMVPKVYYLQVSLRHPQGKGLLIKTAKTS